MTIEDKIDLQFHEIYCEKNELPQLIVVDYNSFIMMKESALKYIQLDFQEPFYYRGVRVISSTDLENHEIIVI